MPKGHGGDSLTNPDVQLWSQPGRTPTYHVGGNLVRCIPIQVKLECHHFVVVCLQLALHHLITCVAYLEDTREMRPGRRPHPANPVLPAHHTCLLTFRMVSRGRLALSWRERMRVDLRWCFRTGLPSSFPPPNVPSQLSLSSLPEVTSDPP